MSAFITSTGAFLPGPPIDNDSMSAYLGSMLGEGRIRHSVLRANGIRQRHYALDRRQRATHDVYQLAALAIESCLANRDSKDGGLDAPITYLSAGSTHTPFNGPGLSSMLHGELRERGLVSHALEINSNAGICTSAAQALVNSVRAVRGNDHRHALCVGAEQPSAVLKSTAIRPVYDLPQMFRDLRQSKWFMSVFLRFMLSDGAGAFLIQDRPAATGPSFEVTWTHSRSFAHEAPVCMKLDNKNTLLSQDIQILTKYLGPCIKKVVSEAMETHGDHLGNYKVVLPHLSSFVFRRIMLNIFRQARQGNDHNIEYWTNLDTRGNTGSASIFIMLDEYARSHDLEDGERILLFIPESGRFNFVLVSLTVVR